MLKPVSFKKLLKIFSVFVITVSGLICLSFLSITRYENMSASISSKGRLSELKIRDQFPIESIQENVSSDISSLQSTEVSSSYTSEPASQLYANVTYHGHDLLKDPPFKFDARFKNPCWYDGNHLNCLPYFFLIGVKKCGTCDLFGKVLRHPQVVVPGFKEVQFFARGRFKEGRDDINIYVDKFEKAATTIDALSPSYFQAGKVNPYITGEGSPSNLHLNTHWMYLPGNEHLPEPRVVILDYIRHILPNAKIIILFRDPVERLYSDYYHEYGNLNLSFNPNPRHFHDTVVKGVDLYTRCFQQRSVRSCVYDAELYSQTKVQMQLGIYYVYWEELLRVFRREQIFVVQNKDLRKEETYRRLYDFLELAPMADASLRILLSKKPAFSRRPEFKKKGPMLNSTFNILYRFYQPFNEKMAGITKDKRFLYDHQFRLDE